MPLGANATKEEYIRHFLDSDAPQFEGKSKRKRVEMALAAYYGKNVQKAQARPLFVARYVKNASDIIKWAKAQGFKTTITPEELHVTVVYSKAPVDWMKADESWGYGSDEGLLKIAPGGPRVVERLGDKGAVVLLFKCRELQWRHESIRNTTGASWDYRSYQPHVTVTYDGADVDLNKIEPYTGEIVLGPEIFASLDNTYVDNHVEKRLYTMLEKEGGNPYHKPSGPGGGQFTSGPSGGGGSKTRATIRHAAGAAAGSVTSHASGEAVDWFFEHKKKKDEEKGKEVNEANHETARRVTKTLVGIGVELAATSMYGQLLKATLPFLTGPGKHIAVAAATLMFERYGPEIKASLPVMKSTLIKAVQTMQAAGFGKAIKDDDEEDEGKEEESAEEVDGAEDNSEEVEVDGAEDAKPAGDDFLNEEPNENVDEEVVKDQIARLLAVLEDMDTSETAVDDAKRVLKEEDPSILDEIMGQTDSMGHNDYHSIVEAGKASARVVKVDKSLGLVFGWAIVCKQNGKDYYDLNIDHGGERVPEHIPESAMLKAASEFMEHHRVAREMHAGDQQGTVVFAFPMTTDIAKSLGIETKVTGLLIAMKPGPAMLEKFVSGALKGFSIGGSRVKSREWVDSEAA